jgi:hypothetical protein
MLTPTNSENDDKKELEPLNIHGIETFDEMIDEIFNFVGNDMLICLQIAEFLLQTSIAAMSKPVETNGNIADSNI